MRKAQLISRAKDLQEQSQRVLLQGYSKEAAQRELTAMSAEIIEAICAHENVTLQLVTDALEMVADIMKDEMLNEAIL